MQHPGTPIIFIKIKCMINFNHIASLTKICRQWTILCRFRKIYRASIDWRHFCFRRESVNRHIYHLITTVVNRFSWIETACTSHFPNPCIWYRKAGINLAAHKTILAFGLCRDSITWNRSSGHKKAVYTINGSTGCFHHSTFHQKSSIGILIPSVTVRIDKAFSIVRSQRGRWFSFGLSDRQLSVEFKYRPHIFRCSVRHCLRHRNCIISLQIQIYGSFNIHKWE